MRASKRRGRATGDRKIPRGSRVPGDPATDSAIVQAYRPRDGHGRAARRGPHVHPLPPRGAIPTGELAKRREWSFGSHTLVFWLSPVQHLLMTVCPYELGIPAKIVTNTRTESAFPRTSARAADPRVEHDVGFRPERFHDRRVHVRPRACPDPPRPHSQGTPPYQRRQRTFQLTIGQH